ncbi:Protein of uncharacterised function (DUF3203) [Pseudomonas fluorescens]|uniref:Protein of uncharacterized function (DUF3203) n=1 Tax=Pseudomonas fluorescens TaxID=294 RepID=A0A379IE80_PSEFL|nr:DUF3203 family protein [Pseudomonas fluorescens]AIG01336.1 hypothetical protein HZ99_03815 [Pseudomonas fluorescens]SUD31099.1 Protein of uncharacterised function (DUF3203) [Pseudomonas fluorescens]
MPIRIENQTCYFKIDDSGEEQSRSVLQVKVITDSDKAMSAVEIDGQRIYITEAEADALTVAGAIDGRKHLKASTGDSVI